MALHEDQGRDIPGAPEGLDRLGDAVGVVGVAHPPHVPAVGQEARGDVVAEGELGAALDGDAVVVVDPAEVAQHQVAGKGGGLAGDALHHVAVAAQGVDVVIEDGEVRPVEVQGQPAAGHRHADAGGAALAERPGRGLDAGSQVIFRMARALAVDLAELLDVIEGDRGLAQALIFGVDRRDAGQVQQGIEQHRGMAVGQHEAVAVRPDRIRGIEAQEALPQRVGHRRQRHGRTGMAGFRLLDGIHRERADGIDAEFVHGTLIRRFRRISGGLGGCRRRCHRCPPHSPKDLKSSL
jgi:hypothetical protein